MKKCIFCLALTLVMCLGLSIPASAYSMGKAGQANIVSAGDSHTGLIDKNGSLWTWGYNLAGGLGNGGGGNKENPGGYFYQTVPIKVSDNVVTVSCGDGDTAVIKADGSLWMWGYYDSNTMKYVQTPVKVLDNVVAVSCGYEHTAAIKTDGSLWTWGSNTWGQLGRGTSTDSAVPIKVMDNAVAVSCGQGNTAAIKADGSLWMWGDNQYGELGNGGQANQKYNLYGSPISVQDVPIKVMDNVVAVSCGSLSTAVIKTDGSLWEWGDKELPTKMMDDVASVSCGGAIAAVKTDGSLWMWGNNGDGELGNGYVGNMMVDDDGEGAVPVQTVPVKLMDGVATVSCAGRYTTIVKTDGSVWACGANEAGELGNGGTSNSVDKYGNGMQTTPVKLSFSTTSTTPNTAPAISNNVKIDTGKTLTVKAGKTYQFKLTANSKPTFVSGNPKVFSVTYKGHTGNDYFYQVKAVGKVGQGAGFYLNGSKTPVTIATIS